MSFQIRCPQCGTELIIQDEQEGMNSICPVCQSPIKLSKDANVAQPGAGSAPVPQVIKIAQAAPSVQPSKGSAPAPQVIKIAQAAPAVQPSKGSAPAPQVVKIAQAAQAVQPSKGSAPTPQVVKIAQAAPSVQPSKGSAPAPQVVKIAQAAQAVQPSAAPMSAPQETSPVQDAATTPTTAPKKKRLWLWIVLSIVAAAIIAGIVLVVFFLILGNKSQKSNVPTEEERMEMCMSNLKQIGIACYMYAEENKDYCPNQLNSKEYKRYLENSAALQCPSSEAGDGYVYLGKGMALGRVNPQLPIAFDKPGHHGDKVNVLFLDGHVETIDVPNYTKPYQVWDILAKKYDYDWRELQRLSENSHEN